MTDGGAEPAVLTEHRDRVLLVTLNRPDQRNAINAAVANGIAAALDELDADGGLSIGVITGAGKGFCSGMDLKAFVTGDSRGARLGIPGVKRSLVAAGGGLLRLPRMLPRNIAMEMALTGDLILAERAA